MGPPTPARSVSNTYPVPGLEPPLWPGGQNIVHEIRGVFELLNSHEFKIQLFCPRGAQLWDPACGKADCWFWSHSALLRTSRAHIEHRKAEGVHMGACGTHGTAPLPPIGRW